MGNKILKPTQDQAEEAVRTLIRWLGDDPSRAGLLDTPKRVLKSYKECFIGYDQDPIAIINKTFTDVESYNGMVLLQDINFISFCEHHLLPFKGVVNVAYMPNDAVVGISKIARIVDIFSKRLQIQERLTAQIANTINSCLKPLGVAVSIVAEHECMSCRGANKNGVKVRTNHLLGIFSEDDQLRHTFLTLSDKK
jgi:GTP cyclohydrolase I